MVTLERRDDLLVFEAEGKSVSVRPTPEAEGDPRFAALVAMNFASEGVIVERNEIESVIRGGTPAA